MVDDDRLLLCVCARGFCKNADARRAPMNYGFVCAFSLIIFSFRGPALSQSRRRTGESRPRDGWERAARVLFICPRAMSDDVIHRRADDAPTHHRAR
jgi:hypothetical protein